MSKPLLERDIESRVCDYAKSKGWLTYKWVSPGHNFVPDRIFISPMGQFIAIEFKREGQKPTPMQIREHGRLRGHMVIVLVIDNVEDGKRWIDEFSEEVPK